MSDTAVGILEVFKRKGMLRTELMQFLGPKDMVVFASINKAAY